MLTLLAVGIGVLSLSEFALWVWLWQISKQLPGKQYDFLQGVARDAVAYAEEKAATHHKKSTAYMKWSWQDKRDAAVEFAKRQAPGVKVEELILRIEAELGTLRREASSPATAVTLLPKGQTK